MEDEELIALLQKGTGDGLHAFDLMGFAADRLEALRAERDALRDRAFRYDIGGGFIRSMGADFVEAEFVLLLARAEKAEAENARLRELAEALADAADDVGVQHFDTDTIPGYVGAMQAATLAVRATLAPVEAKGGDDGR